MLTLGTPSNLGATMEDAVRVMLLKEQVAELKASWPTDYEYYLPEAFRDLYLAILDTARVLADFYQSYSDKWVSSGIRDLMRRDYERIYAAGGVLDFLMSKYNAAMTAGLANDAQVHAPAFRADAFASLDTILDCYDHIVLTQANDFFGQTAGTTLLDGLESATNAIQEITYAAGRAIAWPGKKIVEAGKAAAEAASGAGKGAITWVLIGVGGVALIGATYWFIRAAVRPRRKK